MTDSPRSKKRLGCLILIGFTLFIVLWGTVGPTRGPIPTPMADARALPGIETVLAPLPAPVRGMLRTAARSVQWTAMRLASPFGKITSVRARLVDWHGQPIAGASLRAEAFGYALDARSDAKGQVLLETRIIVGWVNIMLEARAQDGSGWRRRVPMWPGQATDLGDLCLVPGRMLTGRVVTPDGEPVEGASVRLTEPRRVSPSANHPPSRIGPAPSTVSDVHGRFHFAWAPTGSLRVAAQLGTERNAAVQWGHHDLTSFEEPRLPITVVLTSSVPDAEPIHGVVIGLDGQPVSKARLWCQFLGGGGGGEAADEQGRFEIRDHRELSELTATNAHGTDRITRCTPFPAGPIELVLEPARTMSFVIQDNRGRHPMALSMAIFAGAQSDPFSQWQSFSKSSHVKHDGGPLLASIPDGRFHAVVTALGYRTATSTDVGPELPAGPVTILLEALPVVEGRVFKAGQPLAGAVVRLIESDANGRQVGMMLGSSESLLTDETGRFRLMPGYGQVPGFPMYSGSWTHAFVRARFAGNLAESPPLSLVGEHVITELEIQEPGAITGRLVMTDGGSPAFWYVEAARPSDRGQTAVLGPDGGFRFEDLKPGPWWIGVIGKGAPSYRLGGSQSFSPESKRSQDAYEPIDVKPGETARVQLDWQPPEIVRIHGSVTLNGQPSTLDRVTVSSSTRVHSRPNTPSSGTTDRNGEFVIWLTGTEEPKFAWSRNTDQGSTSVRRPLSPLGDNAEVHLDITTANIRILPGLTEGTLWFDGSTTDGDTVTSSLKQLEGIWPLPIGSGTIHLKVGGVTTRRLSIEIAAGMEQTIAPAALNEIP